MCPKSKFSNTFLIIFSKLTQSCTNFSLWIHKVLHLFYQFILSTTLSLSLNYRWRTKPRTTIRIIQSHRVSSRWVAISPVLFPLNSYIILWYVCVSVCIYILLAISLGVISTVWIAIWIASCSQSNLPKFKMYPAQSELITWVEDGVPFAKETIHIW